MSDKDSKTNDPAHASRRAFLQNASLGALLAFPAVSLLSGRLKALAQAGGAKAPLIMIKESDPQAISLGYKEDATKVDVKKFPKRAGPEGKTQFCRTCSFYQEKAANATKEAAPCPIFALKGAKAGGWCQTWAKKS